MFRFGCGEVVTVYVPTRYDYKAIARKCGSTAYDGGVNQCEECSKKHNVPLPYENEGDMEWHERVMAREERFGGEE
jgi:hypothetical protein